jgi:periplasmic divalent cation tolerance protein
MTQTPAVLLYIPCKDKPQAETIARALLDARLIACANLLDTTSLYRWEGDIARESECLLLAKSVPAQVARVIETVTRLHSYALPGITALPITAGHAPFLDWIVRETA